MPIIEKLNLVADSFDDPFVCILRWCQPGRTFIVNIHIGEIKKQS